MVILSARVKYKLYLKFSTCFKEGVGKSFARKGLIPIVSQVEMSDLMRAEFQASCGDQFKRLQFEILSMLDSEICTVAPVFYYSIMSSYSMNIQQERVVRTNGITRFVSLKYIYKLKLIF